MRVRLAILPNSATGWVPQDALGAFNPVRTRLVIDRNPFLATLRRGGRVVFRARVGVGEPRWPTPRGNFYVREQLTGFGDSYGPVAFGTARRSPPDGLARRRRRRHPRHRPPGIIPGRVSHGCIRVPNTKIRRLDRLMPLGTPVPIV